MKKFIKKNAISKTAITILIITLISIISPIWSNAEIGISTLTKPFSGMIMRTIDGFNALLATLFASDEKMKSIAETVEEIKDVDNTKNLFQKIAEGLDECQDGFYNLLLSNEKFEQAIETPDISFIGHVCQFEGVYYIVAVWKIPNMNINPIIYMKKKDELVI